MLLSISMLLTASSWNGISAQEPPDTSIAAILASVRSLGIGNPARVILSQEGGPVAAQKIDALADSLVAIASGFRTGGTFADKRMAMASISALREAGSTLATTRYVDAFSRLRETYERSEDVGIRAATLYSMTTLPDTAAVIEHLRAVAVSGNSNAHGAVSLLNTDAGPAGVQALRELYENRSVVEIGARLTLDAIARTRGWN